MSSLPLDSMVIYFRDAGAEVVNNADLFGNSKETFLQGTYWKIAKSNNAFVVLENPQSRETKTITYGMLGKILSFNTEKILLMHTSKVPKVISL